MRRKFFGLMATIVVLSIAACSGSTQESMSSQEGMKAMGPTSAVCVLRGVGGKGVTGTVHFTQEDGHVRVHGMVSGLAPGKHGFHVHQYGDLTDAEMGKSAGGHYNPTDKPHGRPSDAERHVGDLGNITANEQGVAQIDLTDSVIQLSGDHSIIGRSLMIHVGEDDFGQPTGNAGARAAFGVIGITGS